MHIFDLINIRLYLISLYTTFPYSLKNPLRIVILRLYPFENLTEIIDHLPEKKSPHIQGHPKFLRILRSLRPQGFSIRISALGVNNK